MKEFSARPILDQYLSQLVDELVRDNLEVLGHICSSNILFVSGAARRANRASIRPFRYATEDAEASYIKPSVKIDKHAILYEVCLRPLFFLEGNSESRISTIAHELWHISDGFDGTLEESRRHRNMSDTVFSQQVERILENSSISKEVRDVFGYEGECFIQAWKQRPPSRIKTDSSKRKAYDERDLYRSVITQKNILSN